MTLSGTPTEIKVGTKGYVATVDGGTATVTEYRNGAWRAAFSLADGVSSPPTFFQGRKIQVVGSGEFEIKRVTF